MIDYSTIQRILDTADITDVVSEFVTLRRRGVNMLGLCPFHNEKTPSFTVSPAKGIFKCFGCGKGGNAVNFIMEHESLTYPDALKWLAKKYNIDVVEEEETEEQKQLKDERESLMIVSAFAQKYFSRSLWEENEGRTIGLSYFRERSFRDDTLKKFAVGYSPDGKAPFTEKAQKQGYKMEFLEKTGLSIKRDDWVRDRFAGRVMFPIFNLAGRVIAFGGRILKDDPKAAKYLNSPESEIYHKSKVLYGIYQAKREISRTEKCYLVEGYTDVLSMHQAGIENVVASSGTALTPDQIRLVKRFTPNITIIYDGDAAGIKASLRGIDLVLEEGMNVKVLLLPDGEDPDSFAKRKGASGFREYINENETDFIQFKTRLLLKDAEKDPVARARLITDVIRSVAVIPDTITRSVYIKECSRLLDVDEEILYTEIRKQKYRQNEEFKKKEIRDHRRQTFTQPEKPTQSLPEKQAAPKMLVEEREFLRFLLKHCNTVIFEEEGETPDEVYEVRVGDYMVEELENDDLVPKNPLFRKVFFEVKENLDNENFDPLKHFIYHTDAEVSKLATDLLSEKFTESKRWTKSGAFTEKEEEILDYLVPRIVYEYKLRRIMLMLEDIEKSIDEASKEKDFDKVIEEQSKYMNLKRVEKFLSEKLGSRTIN
ncbi:DNA primase [Mariniphaga anaerophila]|uniref:DNA primase n=1 Tax=Mariniphaga anaerophila TaxID=1484053 RepID=A0A1M4YWL7_9BACT|nr:DNA primase [Mariniphaga anaerophila]SHF10214.1 DNA primase [Mariniphaga anaerophila]